MTSALHAEGPEFNPRLGYCFGGGVEYAGMAKWQGNRFVSGRSRVRTPLPALFVCCGVFCLLFVVSFCVVAFVSFQLVRWLAVCPKHSQIKARLVNEQTKTIRTQNNNKDNKNKQQHTHTHTHTHTCTHTRTHTRARAKLEQQI